VLAGAGGEGALGVLCLGDLVGYGADPVACVETVGERASAMVAGNHEHGALGLLDLRWFNPWARAAAQWTGEQLADGHRGFLTSLPLVRTMEDATLVHASPHSPEEWDYLVSEEDGLKVFGDFDTRLCFIGHCTRRASGRWAVGDRIIRAGSTGRRRTCGSTTVAGTWSTWAASASRATATRAPATPSGTARLAR
jgi:hypothetical protein